jgi:hypothetical protein
MAVSTAGSFKSGLAVLPGEAVSMVQGVVEADSKMVCVHVVALEDPLECTNETSARSEAGTKMAPCRILLLLLVVLVVRGSDAYGCSSTTSLLSFA